jgi:transglutaminase-like putative cysteine protease
MNGDGFLPVLDEAAIAALPLLDHQGVDWGRVERTAYLIHQHLRYEYPGPIDDLRQRLVIVPPEWHGDQRRVVHRLAVSVPVEETRSLPDRFGNLVVELDIPHVEHAVDFEAWVVVQRSTRHGPQRLPASWPDHTGVRLPSPLTEPGPLLQGAAREFDGHNGLALAERITMWVYRHISYAHDATDIHTTAEQALSLGRGVCQDYAHVMVALCRLCGLPARYVSGHLLGEGGTHAWVEVLVPAGDGTGDLLAWPFDPTHDRRAGMSYVTVAVGRDYAAVAPTSGTFRAPYPGWLSARKRVGLTAVQYLAPPQSPQGAA